MNVRKFIAATARDALRKVKETSDRTRSFCRIAAIPGGVEIMAVAARHGADRAAPERRAAAAHRAATTLHASLSGGRRNARPGTAAAARHARPPKRPTARRPRRWQPAPRRRRRRRPLPQKSVCAGRRSDPKPAAEVVPAAVMEEIRSHAPDRRAAAGRLRLGRPRVRSRSRPCCARCSTPVSRRSWRATCWPNCRRELDARQALSWVKGVPTATC
jgi:flagellar biosynthesis protein FlhF